MEQLNVAVPVQSPGVSVAETVYSDFVPSFEFAKRSSRLHVVFGVSTVAVTSFAPDRVITGGTVVTVTTLSSGMSPLRVTSSDAVLTPVPPEPVKVTRSGTVIL